MLNSHYVFTLNMCTYIDTICVSPTKMSCVASALASQMLRIAKSRNIRCSIAFFPLPIMIQHMWNWIMDAKISPRFVYKLRTAFPMLALHTKHSTGFIFCNNLRHFRGFASCPIAIAVFLKHKTFIFFSHLTYYCVFDLWRVLCTNEMKKK